MWGVVGGTEDGCRGDMSKKKDKPKLSLLEESVKDTLIDRSIFDAFDNSCNLSGKIQKPRILPTKKTELPVSFDDPVPVVDDAFLLPFSSDEEKTETKHNWVTKELNDIKKNTDTYTEKKRNKLKKLQDKYPDIKPFDETLESLTKEEISNYICLYEIYAEEKRKETDLKAGRLMNDSPKEKNFLSTRHTPRKRQNTEVVSPIKRRKKSHPPQNKNKGELFEGEFTSLRQIQSSDKPKKRKEQ
eukprot:TRINITY_DN3042_c0_g2_i1.p1 TRINITY_DN3042_c0_g2~~TRINITY_DN3042_c0_g2_i1.p1  ORF type:complete len:243 (-),score=58.19 TRINITY_DN3042_c0_g2_i1:45-773(-)